MTAGFVENHAAEAVFNGHGHDACGAIAGTGHGHSLLRGLLAHDFGIDDVEHLQTHPASGRCGTGLAAHALVGNGGNGQPGADLAVLGIEALGGGDENVVVHIQQGAGGLGDAGIIAGGGKVAFLQNGNLLLVAHADGGNLHGVNAAENPFPQNDVDAGGALTQCLGSLTGAADQTAFGHIHGGCHDAAQALVNPDRRAGNDGILHAVHLVCDHIDGMIDSVFSENLRVIGAGGYGNPENPLANFS